MKYNIVKISIRDLLEKILVLCVIIEFYTTYTINVQVLRYVQIIPVIILPILILISQYSIVRRENLFYLVYLLGAIFPLLPMTSNAYPGYILRYILILPLLWIYMTLRKNNGTKEYLSILYIYSNIVIIISCISIIMWLLCSVLKVIQPTAIIPYEWGGHSSTTSYYGIYFETQSSTIMGFPIWRNSSIFNEAPMFNMILCVALTIECFMKSNISKIKIGILSITILTTQTTTGQLFLILITLLYLYIKNFGKHKNISVMLILLFLFGSILIADSIVDNKIKTGGDNSIKSRTEDIITCIEVGMKHPILGVGLVTTKEDKLVWEGKEFGYSNSIFAIFARGGLYALSLYLIALILIPYLYYKKHRDKKLLFTMLCFFIVFSFTNSYAKYLTLIFLAWGLSNINLKLVK